MNRFNEFDKYLHDLKIQREDYQQNRSELIEQYIKLYLQQTNTSITDICLFEQRHGVDISIRIGLKSEIDQLTKKEV